MNAADVGAVIEAKDGSGLVQGDVLGKPYYILVESTAHKLELGHCQCQPRNGKRARHTSEKMKVLAGSNPMEMMSFALLPQ